MRIALQKGMDGSDQVVCHRSDGSILTETLLLGSAYHDLAHFVVERELGMQEGFWGMIAQGFSIAEYNLPNAQRTFQISPEGYAAEFLATLVQSAVPTGAIAPAYLEMLRQACKASGLPFPDLPPPEVTERLISQAQMLTAQWESLAAGEEMWLEF